MKTFHLKTRLLCAALALWMSPMLAWAIDFDIAPPESGSHVRDIAELITEDDEVLIDEWCAALQLEHTVPVAVVTIESMGQYGAENMHVETFARGLFEKWGDDPAFNPSDDWRRGVLLLISKGDRKARIELGGTWPPDYIARCVRIMDQIIVPQFKKGDFSRGAVAGVEAIVEMVRGRSDAAPGTLSMTTSTTQATLPGAAPDDAAGSTHDAPSPQPAIVPPIRRSAPQSGQHVSYPSHREYRGEASTGAPRWFHLAIFGMIAFWVLMAMRGLMGNSRPTNRNHLGMHRHFSGGIRRSSGSRSHGGGGGATGSW